MIIEKPRSKKNGVGVMLSQRVKYTCDGCGVLGYRGYGVLQKQEIHRCKKCATIFHNTNRTPAQKSVMIEAAAKVWRGRKREEVIGAERSRLERQAQSARNSGANNPNYGGRYSRGFADAPLIGSWESVFGKERAIEKRAEASLRNLGANNPMYGKPSPYGSGNGISGWWKGELYFRSLLELAFVLRCAREGVKISSAERAKYRVPYVDWDGSHRTYTPDFIDADGNLYEIKPYALLGSASNSAKQKVAPNVIWVTDKQLSRPTLDELDRLIETKCVRIDPGKQRKIDEYRRKLYT